MVENKQESMTDLDIEILAMARKGIPPEDICIILNITKKQYKERLQVIKSIRNVYKEPETILIELPPTKRM